MKAKSIMKSAHAEYWSNTLNHLQVQKKFKDTVVLEVDCPIWNRIIAGSFLIRDCLPTPLNLRRWKIKSSSKCILCESPQPTTSHILNGCQTALAQGRFTWRHDSVLNKLVNMTQPLIPSSCQIYADIPSWRASDSPPATLPNNISTSTLRPDLVLILNNNITILELTIPSNNKEALQAA